MGNPTAKYAQGKPKQPQREGLRPQERQAFRTLRSEAAQRGVKLANGGRGGLPPSLVLGVMRRDNFTCKVCGGTDPEKGAITVHHKGGLDNPTSRWLQRKGKSNDPNNLVTLHERCHDGVHNADRARGEGVES